MLLGASPPESSDAAATDIKDVPDSPSSYGLEVLHATALAIVDCHQENLLDSDFENAMKALTSWVPIRDVEHFIGVVQAEWRQHQSKQRKA
jgi:hypothetical protein